MIFVDSNLFVIDLRSPADVNYRANRRAVDRLARDGTGMTSVLNLLEICGILSFNLSSAALHALYVHFPRRCRIAVVPSSDYETRLPAPTARELLARIEKMTSRHRLVSSRCRSLCGDRKRRKLQGLRRGLRPGGREDAAMAVRHGSQFSLLGLLAVAFGLFAVAAMQAVEQSGPSRTKASSGRRDWILARTPDGHPDFQGVWANNTVTPLERPKQWEGKTLLTDAEIADLQKRAARIVQNDGDAQFGDSLILAALDGIENPISYDPGTGNYNQFWLVDRDWHDRRTSLIIDPPDGKIPPMTPEGQKRREAEIAYRKAHAFEDPEVFPLGERCVNFGIPRLQAAYNSYIQIIQSPGYVTIMSEMAHDARIIPLDGRPHVDDRIRFWNGDSRGRWEGDTLVIETTNFSPKSDFRGSHENLRLTERLMRVSPDVLNYEFTVNDRTMWTKPWTAMIQLKLKNELIYEYACHEGNDALPDMLRGHRFEERQAVSSSRSK